MYTVGATVFRRSLLAGVMTMSPGLTLAQVPGRSTVQPAEDAMTQAARRLKDAAAREEAAERYAGDAREQALQEADRLRRESLNLYDRAWREDGDPSALFLSAGLLYLLTRPVAAAEAAERFLTAVDRDDPKHAARIEPARQLVLGGIDAIARAEVDPEQVQMCETLFTDLRKGVFRVIDPIRGEVILLRDGQPDGVWKSTCAVDLDDPAGTVDAGDGMLWSGVGLTVIAATMGVLAVALAARDKKKDILKGGGDQERLHQYTDHVALASGLGVGALVAAGVGVGLIIGGAGWTPSGPRVEGAGLPPAPGVGIGGVF